MCLAANHDCSSCSIAKAAAANPDALLLCTLQLQDYCIKPAVVLCIATKHDCSSYSITEAAAAQVLTLLVMDIHASMIAEDTVGQDGVYITMTVWSKVMSGILCGQFKVLL